MNCKEAKWLSLLQEIALRELYRKSPMRKKDLSWVVATKYLRIERVIEIEAPVKLSINNLHEYMKKIVVKKPKLPNNFLASFSRSLKSLEYRGLIEIYKTSSGVKVRITENGRKIVEHYLL